MIVEDLCNTNKNETYQLVENFYKFIILFRNIEDPGMVEVTRSRPKG